MSSLLEDFHRLADLPVNKALTGHTFNPRALCVLEEMGETKEAIHHLQGLLRTVANPKAIRDSSLHLLKEMMDTRYTIASFCLALGWDEDEAYLEVCRSNYSKVSDGHLMSPEGKVVKGPNYEPANLTACVPCEREAEANAMVFEAPLEPKESLRSRLKSVLVKDIGAMGSSRFRRLLDQLEAAVGDAR